MQINIYKITNKINGKVYIGQTHRDIMYRFLEHSRTDSVIGNAIRSDGIEFFDICLIESVSADIANERECFWISKLNSTNPRYGYNVSSGGTGVHGYEHSEETKHKISEASKNRIAIHKNTDVKCVSSEVLNFYIDDGWELGRLPVKFHDSKLRSARISEKTKGLKCFSDGVRLVKISEIDIPKYKAQGFKPATKGRDGTILFLHKITDGIKIKTVNDRTYHDWLNKGWICINDINLMNLDFKSIHKNVLQIRKNIRVPKFQAARKNHEVTLETRQKISASLTGRKFEMTEARKAAFEAKKGVKRCYLSQDARDAIREANKKKIGKICITNGLTEKFIDKDDLNRFIQLGWFKGRRNPSSTNTVWVNNTIKNKRIAKNKLSEYESMGYSKGRLKCQ